MKQERWGWEAGVAGVTRGLFRGGDPNRENKVAGKAHSEWRELSMKAVKKVEFDI